MVGGFVRTLVRMRWLAVVVSIPVVLSGCGLVTQSSDGASVGAPTPTDDVRAIPIDDTTTTTSPDLVTTTLPVVGEGENLPMNISDDYVIGRPGNEECDAAFSMVARGVDLASLQPDDPIEEYIAGFERSIVAGKRLVAISTSTVLTTQANGSLAYFTDLLALANSGVTVAELREAINGWATKDGVNAGTWLLGVQQECPEIVSGVLIPETVYGPSA